ncbi:hypothetical protein DSECCO2_579040 [anaerobic digester metagenome]
MVLHDAQELGLGGQRHVPDLVEKDRALAGHLEESGLAVLEAAREGAADVAEELAFQEVLGQGRAVDGHEGPGAAAGRVHGPGEELLARARCAADADDGVRGRDELGVADEVVDGLVLADDVRKADLRWLGDAAGQHADLLHVPGDLHGADDVPASVADGAAGGEVLEAARRRDQGLLHVRPLAALQAFEDGCVGQAQFAQVASQGLVLLQAQDLAGHGVHGRDATRGVHGDDPVGDVVQDHAQPAGLFLLGQGVDGPRTGQPRDVGQGLRQVRRGGVGLAVFDLHVDMGQVVHSVHFHGHDVEHAVGDAPRQVGDDADAVAEDEVELDGHVASVPLPIRGRPHCQDRPGSAR